MGGGEGIYSFRFASFKRQFNFSIFLLRQVKIPDEKNTRHVYLLGKDINKPLVHFSEQLSSLNSPARIYHLHLTPFWVPCAIRPSTISENHSS